MPVGAQHAGGQRDLCAGQVPAVDPAGASVQRRTESRRKGVRKGAWLSGGGNGRKTANVVRGNIYGIPSVVVDTHVRRVSNMLGFTNSQDPVKIEFELMELLPVENWIAYNTQIIAHGRKICIARRPKCDICFLSELCDHVQNNKERE